MANLQIQINCFPLFPPGYMNRLCPVYVTAEKQKYQPSKKIPAFHIKLADGSEHDVHLNP